MPGRYANRFWTFISDPSEPLRLKLFLENARNYTIAVATLAAGFVVSQSDGGWSATVAGYFLVAIGGTQGVGCILQSWVLFLRAFHTYVGYSHTEDVWVGSVKVIVLLLSMVMVPLSGWHLIAVLVAKAIPAVR